MIVDDQFGGSIARSGDSTVSQKLPHATVTWHVILWILLTLGLNSMAQPSRKLFTQFSRHRIYICISPIICLADTIATVAYIFIAKVYIGISFKKATQIVVLSKPTYGTNEHRKQPRLNELQTEDSLWPRFILFVLGPIPAAVKLASFSGTPWTKAWGLIFITSFTVNEILNSLSRCSITGEDISLSVILDSGLMEQNGNPEQTGNDGVNIQLLRAARLQNWIALVIAPIMITGGLAHMYLMVYAVQPLWYAAWRCVPSTDIINIVAWTGAIASLFSIFFLGCWLAAFYFRYINKRTGPRSQEWTKSASEWSKSALKWTWIIAVAAHSPTCQTACYREEVNKNTFETQAAVAIGTYIYLVHLLLYWGMTRICRRLPNIAKILLVDQKIQDSNIVQGQVTDSGPSARVAHMTVDNDSSMCLGFFLVNLLFCILWYAYIYDPVGTINPAWTDVFG